eukprot:3879107-Pleurochrysis_carterae.AAC.1
MATLFSRGDCARTRLSRHQDHPTHSYSIPFAPFAPASLPLRSSRVFATLQPKFPLQATPRQPANRNDTCPSTASTVQLQSPLPPKPCALLFPTNLPFPPPSDCSMRTIRCVLRAKDDAHPPGESTALRTRQKLYSPASAAPQRAHNQSFA